MKPYKWHLFVCTGPRCTNGESENLFQSLAEKLREQGMDEGNLRVKRTRCNCFAICKGGPIVVVYPGGTWYQGVTPGILDRILVEHLRNDNIVSDHVYHQASNQWVK